MRTCRGPIGHPEAPDAGRVNPAEQNLVVEDCEFVFNGLTVLIISDLTDRLYDGASIAAAARTV